MLGEIVAILAVLTFVVSNVIFRKTEKEVTPTYINFFRTAIGTLTFFLIGLVLNQFNLIFIIPWELWILLIISLVFGQVIGDTAYFVAQKELGTTIALAISMTYPLFTFILSLIFLNQLFKLNLVFSLILIGFGVIIIGKSKNMSKNVKQDNNSLQDQSKPENVKQKSIKAIGFCLIASLGWAIGAVLIQYATDQIDQIIHIKELSSIIGNIIRFPFATMILGSMVLREKILTKNSNYVFSKKISRQSWVYLLVASLIGTSLGAYLYTESVHIATANVVSLIATASPLFALPLTFFINKEKISRFGFIGVVLTILGVVLILI
ncbi:MAG: DMT family transporter [Candidatus Lokiarchaeia archaeon]|nr:DMT family transporter [Candidatus Lokiarchaeia archaeon]